MGLKYRLPMPLITTPHADVELGYPRRDLPYAVVVPEAGIGPRTGLIVYIFGFGGAYDDAYAQKLLPYLANDHDCVAVAVDYHGGTAQSRLNLSFAPDFFVNLRDHHGISVNITPGVDPVAFRRLLFQTLAEAGVQALHPACRLIKEGESYINFGVLPALDLLQVVARVIAEHGIDRRRIFALGTSYGGYLALLLAKLAPNTFRFVVDNCGFSNAADAAGVVYGFTTLAEPVAVQMVARQAFSADPRSPAHFNASRQAIRDLAVASHYHLPSATFAYSYHGTQDHVASPQAKQALSALLQSQGRRHHLRMIGSQDVDGQVFKVPDHGFKASMRGLFRLSMERWLSEPGHDLDPDPITDFDLGTVTMLECAELDYLFEFSPAGVRLTIC